MKSLVRCSRALRSPFQPNLTSLTNQTNRNEQFLKFGNDGKRVGIPRIPRLKVRPIAILHETPHLMVAGRNFCNGFSNNQYLLINKETKHCIFVDACDDWPDDWAAFLSSSNLIPTHIFLTHCHIDCIINLSALTTVVEQHLKVRMGLMWCPAEQCWVDAFPRACERYERHEEKIKPLPFAQDNLYSYYTYAHKLQEKQREAERQQAAELARSRQRGSGPSKYADDYLDDATGDSRADVPLPPQLVRQQDVLLSCATNRSTSFHPFGNHSVLHYIFTPGHSPGHMMLSLPREKLLFTGDVLFYNGVGRVDLPWATGEKLAESLFALESHPDNTVLLPGHGRLTTLGRERRHNAALRSLYDRKQLGLQEISVGFNDGYL